jgi:hypothetical protein
MSRASKPCAPQTPASPPAQVGVNYDLLRPLVEALARQAARAAFAAATTDIAIPEIGDLDG